MSLLDRKVAVIGLGYVGLPLAALCAKKGYRVVGLDANQETVASLAKGKCHIRDDAVGNLILEVMASVISRYPGISNLSQISGSTFLRG